jgi:hypothetical protein
VANINLPVQPAAQSTVQVPFFNQKPNDVFEYQIYDPIYNVTYTTTSSSPVDVLQSITIPVNIIGTPTSWNISRNNIPYATIFQDA